MQEIISLLRTPSMNKSVLERISHWNRFIEICPSDMSVENSHRTDGETSCSDDRLTQAIVLLEDAFSFRSIGHKLYPSNVLKLYRWYWSAWTQYFLKIVVSCQLLLIFVQYPSSWSRTSDLTQNPVRYALPCALQLVIEFLCLIIFYIDAIIRVNLC